MKAKEIGGLVLSIFTALFFFFAALLFLEKGNFVAMVIASTIAAFVVVRPPIAKGVRWWHKTVAAFVGLFVLAYLY